jgi:hypothetical protein
MNDTRDKQIFNKYFNYMTSISLIFIIVLITAVIGTFGLGAKKFFFPNGFNCIKIDNKAIFVLQ